MNTTIVVTMLACLTLTACYNELDWREAPSAQGRYSITLPARPQEQTRSLNSAAGAVPMTMVSAQAADWVFGVAYADYPAAVDANAHIDEQRDALLRNISGRVTNEKIANIGGKSGRLLTAEGHKGDSPVVLHARFVADGSRLYQIAAAGTKGGVPETELDTFLDSFKLLN
ncbi:MAG: hypothetical protein EXR27_22110 [Betaproteobacteria bacterium]|nr:hypothetical protein [Betaproteobacteria bacterium]